MKKFYFVKGQVPGAAFLLAMGAGIFFTCQLQTVCAKYQYQESRIDIIHSAKIGNDSTTDTVQNADIVQAADTAQNADIVQDADTAQNADMLQSTDIILPSDFREAPTAFFDGTTWEEEDMVDYGFVSELNEIPISPFHD
ncbi:hypothetical protein OCV70_15145 [Blautia acetigignens]|uniref:hypothetical protein n=1 Tax=Blautia acetigignens TaxID=2981783 RepID=UPI0021D0D2C4|nr:hypothetical protein [Blautia acetigignens]MCU6775936.1 hypothetical protein [Blautia acetigignens]